MMRNKPYGFVLASVLVLFAAIGPAVAATSNWVVEVQNTNKDQPTDIELWMTGGGTYTGFSPAGHLQIGDPGPNPPSIHWVFGNLPGGPKQNRYFEFGVVGGTPEITSAQWSWADGTTTPIDSSNYTVTKQTPEFSTAAIFGPGTLAMIGYALRNRKRARSRRRVNT
jgi:hypothetical protein